MARGGRKTPPKAINWLYFNQRNAESDVHFIGVPGHPAGLSVGSLKWAAAFKKHFNFQVDKSTLKFRRPNSPLLWTDVDENWIKTVGDAKGVSYRWQPASPVGGLFDASWSHKHVHLLVMAEEPVQDSDSPPAIPVQSQPASTSVVDKLVRLRITNDPPSTIAEIDNYRIIQGNGEQKIWDDRPQKDKLIAPIALLYQPFGYFRDVRYGVEIPGEEGVHEGELKEKVDALANEMTLIYKSEEDRRAEFVLHLERIFDLSPGSINPGRIPGSQKISDGHLNGVHGAMVICVECKNELSSASCEPIPQLSSHIATSFATQTKDNYYKELFQRWRIPALGVTHVGPTVQFFGVVSVGQIRVVPLTQPPQLVDPTGEELRWDLFLAFKAAALVFSKIRSDVGEFLRVLRGSTEYWPPVITTERCCFPSVTEINAFPGPQPERIEFVLNARHDDFENRHLYQATIVSPIQQNNIIYVKFSQRYSVDLHAFCASKGLAPKLLGFEQLSGGWFMVAMENIKTVDREETASPSNAEKWEKYIKELVDGFHREGLVHGDLRLANFVFTRDPQRMLLVDFDRGGKEGEVMFPHEFLIGELEVSSHRFLNRKITQEHDQRCLSKVLRWVREAGEKAKRSGQEMKM